MPLSSTMTPIATNTLTADAASVTFSSIPQGYTDLVLVASNLLSSRTSSQDLPTITFNGDTGTNYSVTNIDGNATSGANSVRWSNLNYIYLGFIPDSNTTANPSLYPGMITANIQNYSNTTTYKTLLSRYNNRASNSNYDRVGAHVGLWRSTAAITSMTIGMWTGPNYKSGATFTLYGIKAAS